MTKRRNICVVLALALTLPVFGEASAEGVAAYVESSGTEQKPRSNAGVSVHGDWLRLRADVALQAAATPGGPAHLRPSGSTEVVPNLRSAFTLAKNLDIETRVRFAEWNAGTDTTFDTRLRYRKSLDAFVDELDSSIWHSGDGSTRQTLRFGFNQLVGDTGAATPLTITGAAILEATHNAATAPAELSNDSRKVGVETRVTGLMSRFVTADHSLSFKVEKTVGMRRESASMLAYDHSWTPSALTSLGFNLEFPRRTYSPADDFEPQIGFNWRSRF